MENCDIKYIENKKNKSKDKESNMKKITDEAFGKTDVKW